MDARRELEHQIHDYTRALRRYAMVLTRDADMAEDLVQDTLTKAVAAAEQWRPGSDLRVWLFRIMHNTHIDDRRKSKVREDAKPMLADPVHDEDPTKRIELQQVLNALAKLPKAQRDPIVLVALKDMSYSDAARALNVPVGTFFSRLARGRVALRQLTDGMKTAKLRLVS
ncbi:MAG: sigma-70 family RNA polymerase sigma factor [Pseudomonadota bacterium]